MRLVKDICEEINGEMMWHTSAMAALHHFIESILYMYFEMLYWPYKFILTGSRNHAAIHARRVTVMPKDSRLIRDLIGIWDPTSWITKEPKHYPGRTLPSRLGSWGGGGRGSGPPHSGSLERKGVAHSKQTARKSTRGKAPRLKDALLGLKRVENV